MEPLPTITSELPGIGGRLKAEPDTFVVEEIALYVPCDQGSHLYVSLTARGMEHTPGGSGAG